jgi:hypothetical protein
MQKQKHIKIDSLKSASGLEKNIMTLLAEFISSLSMSGLCFLCWSLVSNVHKERRNKLMDLCRMMEIVSGLAAEQS